MTSSLAINQFSLFASSNETTDDLSNSETFISKDFAVNAAFLWGSRSNSMNPLKKAPSSTDMLLAFILPKKSASLVNLTFPWIFTLPTS